METLTATKVILDADLRCTHRMRDAGAGLPRGKCWVYVNAARSMFRAVGRSRRKNGGVMISGWAADDEEVDVQNLQSLVSSLKLRINFSDDQEDAINGVAERRRKTVAA